MTKRQAMKEALMFLSAEIPAIAENGINLGLADNEKDSEKICDALRTIANQLLLRYTRYYGREVGK